MSISNESKINKLLVSNPKGVVLLTKWLAKQGYSYSLQARYRDSDWFESIGKGALKRTGEQIDYLGAIYALQKQANMTIHPGGLTALALVNSVHYINFSPGTKTVFGGPKERLPAWFKNYPWKTGFDYYSTSIFDDSLGLTQIMHEGIPILISSRIRAIMECLYLAPKEIDLVECYQLFEGLNNLSPSHVQEHLEKCSSIKVNRLFLYMAHKAKHQWAERLNISKIDLGKGKRSIVKGGVFIPEFNITIPKELDQYD